MAVNITQPGLQQAKVAPTRRRDVLGRIWGNYVVRSLLRVVATIWFVASLLFFLFRLLPSNPIDVYIQDAIVQRGMSVDQARSEATSLFAVDLNRPIYFQYFDYMKELAHFNLGKSLISKSTPVSGIVRTYLPWTLFTVGLGLTISFTLGMALGTMMAYRRESLFDHVLSTLFAFLHGIPQFLLGLLIIFWGGVRFQLFDIGKQRGALTPGVEVGFTIVFFADVLRHAWLPILAYVLTSISHWALLMKNATTAVLEEDFVTVARARGLSDQRIASSYVARNSVLPLVTQAAIAFGFALGGAAIIETVFVYRGLGARLGEALNARDYPVMQGILIIITAAIVISNLVADVLYSRIDPRIRVGGR